MAEQISDAAVVVNDEVIGIVPNSLVFNEGLGEQSVRAMSSGGGAVEQVFANNIESNMSKISFDMPSTIENVKNARSWKTNRNKNTVQILVKTVDGVMTRSFSGAAIVADYDIEVGPEGNISLEFQANKAI